MGKHNTTVMVVRFLHRGGIGTVLWKTAEGLHARGHAVEIITFSPYLPPTELRLPAGVNLWRVFPIWASRLWTSRSYQLRTWGYARRNWLLSLLTGEPYVRKHGGKPEPTAGVFKDFSRQHPRRLLHRVAQRLRKLEGTMRRNGSRFVKHFAWRRFCRRIDRLAPRIILVHEQMDAMRIATMLDSGKDDPPVVGVVHSSNPKLMNDIASFAREKILGKGIIPPRWAVVNPMLTRMVAEKLKIDEREIIDLTNGIDVERIARMARNAKPEADEETILWAAALTPNKCGEDAIEAFAIARRRRPMRLLMLGDGRERARLRALADATGYGSDMLMPGYADNPFADMAACGAFLLTSKSEGLALVLLEALSLGTFCISTDCPHGPGYILNDPRLGCLVPVGDTRELAKAMLMALDRRRTESREDREFRMRNARERFRGDAMIGRYDRLVNALSPLPERTGRP